MKLQILDVDYEVPNHSPVVRLFCKDEKGESKCLFVEDFYPYFYVIPKDENEMIDKLNNEFRGEIKKIKEVEKYLPIGYHEKKEKILKITNKNPFKVPSIRKYLQENNLIEEVFEADILFKYRFLVDHNLGGMDWINVEGKGVNTNTVKVPAIQSKNIEKIEKEGYAPLKYFSFDIECISGDENRMVDAEKDPIILVSISFEPEFKGNKNLVLVAKQGKDNKDTLYFENEEEMLKKFKEIIDDFDPDILIGYNIENFDLPYLLKRLELLGLERKIGRCDKPVFSRKIGQNHSTQISGRVVVDPYSIIKRDPYQKFMDYSLDTVANNILGEGKIDVDWKEMRELWEEGGEKLKKFIEYCRKDSALALNLVVEENMLNKFFELSKISGLLLEDSMGGQTMRIDNLLLKEFNKNDILMPCKPNKKEIKRRKRRRKEEALKGGLVLEPEKGLHTDGCVVVLDFKSLYPSTMRTYNICPTTLVMENEKENVDYEESPNGVKFVKKEVKEGIIPKVAAELIDARSKVKEEMKTEENKEKRKLLNARQLALKTMSNSIYGYTGYVRTRLYLMEIANAITSYGRNLIKKTRKGVQKKFNSKVIYGDTDSVMVKIERENLEKALKLGKKIPKHINKELPGYLELEFEKLFKTFLILTKKRYAGWAFKKRNGDWEDEIEMKGIETVRRDWCKLVSDTMDETLRIILKKGNISRAINYVQEVVEQVKNSEVDLEKLSIVKGITKNLENYEGILPHIELAKKMKDRNPADPPSPGERIGYVIVKGNQMISKRAEDPSYIKQKNLDIDSDYYINSQIIPPLERIFSVIGVDKQELLGSGRQTDLNELLNGKEVKRNHEISVVKDPEETVIKDPENFICKKCDKKFQRVPLNGKCECGGEIYASSSGSIGKVVHFDF